ncbi:uncharacterized protein LOC115886341 [Sitophilus oryzae]|uniref:Uncharacterized protein LOC115886341 n=1 Tax=Sitophilus oryzae TaxID=7048 RepID=A0A6J2YDP8_SITOR|nr:uncharacterized protein LOC115886341 [Sitophilus oryzae]
MDPEEEKRIILNSYLTVYNKDYIPKKIEIHDRAKYITKQEFDDPVCEGFKNYLELDGDNIEPPREACDDYLEKVKKEKPKIGKMYFETPVDHIIVKGDNLLKGKSVYQVEYCDIESDIRRKLLDTNKKDYTLPEGWEIPLTTQKYDFRNPILLNENAMEPTHMIKKSDNLGQNEKINEILQVKTADSEYNQTIGKLGDFIVTEEMHGKIARPRFSKCNNNK